MKSYYFSAYSMLSGMHHLKVFKVYLFTHFNVSNSLILTCSAIRNLKIMSVVTIARAEIDTGLDHVLHQYKNTCI